MKRGQSLIIAALFAAAMAVKLEKVQPDANQGNSKNNELNESEALLGALYNEADTVTFGEPVHTGSSTTTKIFNAKNTSLDKQSTTLKISNNNSS